MDVLRRCAFGLTILLGLAAQGARAQETGILVNGQPLSMQEVTYYGIQLPPGRYWYDGTSGLWGVEGGPSVGQIMAGLPLGGALQADASGGGTGVFINGREIHASELMELMQMFGEVPPGRYWLDANLVGGLEGQPASFDLKAAGAAGSGSSGGGKPYFEDEVADFCARHGGC
jgi:hypothetical protein